MTLSTGRGQFRETVTRGTESYLAVYAAARSSIVAVIGTPRLNVGMLQYQIREIIERIATYSTEFGTWAARATVRTASTETYGSGSQPAAPPMDMPPPCPRAGAHWVSPGARRSPATGRAKS